MLKYYQKRKIYGKVINSNMKKRNLNIYVLTTVFVIKNQSPILYVYHDEDGDWQFLGIEDHLADADSMIISLGEIQSMTLL